MVKNRRIIFRADGNATMGLGHLTRSLALAQVIQPEFTGVFAVRNPSEDFKVTLQNYNLQLLSLPPDTDYLTEAKMFIQQLDPGDVVVLDGYHFNPEYQQVIKSHGHQLVCIDDIHAYPFLADVIINPAGGITPHLYHTELYTRFCLGPDYALLRPPFLEAARQEKTITTIQQVLLNMGGADPANQTLQVLQSVLSYQMPLTVHVVVGAAYQYLSQLEVFGQNNPNIRIYQNLDARAMCQLMQTCEAAILPPSSVAYEWCSVTGLLFLHQIADNQQNLGAFLRQEQMAFSWQQFAEMLARQDINQLIQHQITKQRAYFDGKSSSRLKRIFTALSTQHNIRLRPAQADDMEKLFVWANDPAVRQHSFNPAPIPWEIHQRWFTAKLNSPDTLIFIFLMAEVPAGMIRFDLNNNQATISYLLDENFRGQGLGSGLLIAALVVLSQQRPEIQTVVGHVQAANVASVQSFVKAGFSATTLVPAAATNSLVFVKELNKRNFVLPAGKH